MRYKRGSVTRRHFLAVTALALRLRSSARQPFGFNAKAFAQDLGTKMSLATWPNYHDPATFDAFTAATGVAVEVNVFGSNEEMLAKLQAAALAGTFSFRPTTRFSTYAKLGLIDALDMSLVPNFDGLAERPLHQRGHDRGQDLRAAEELGNTGMAVNTSKLKTPVTSWKEFFDVAMGEADGRAMVHDYQLHHDRQCAGGARPRLQLGQRDDLKKAEELLIKVKPHLFAINSDYQPGMRATDAWMTMCWTNDGRSSTATCGDRLQPRQGRRRNLVRLLRDTHQRHQQAAGYALLNFLMDPANAVKEHLANGAPTTDARVMSCCRRSDLQQDHLSDEASLTPLEFGAAATLTDPGRAEVMARFKSA